MTFDQIATEVMDRLNYSSSTALTRVGRAINRKYRLVTSSIGLQLSRRVRVQQAMSIGISTVTFTNTEKVIGLINQNVTPYRNLKELSIEELRNSQPYTASDGPSSYAVVAQASDSITVEVNCIPQTAFILFADVHQSVIDLVGTAEPAFPKSFHDILIEGVIADELRKMEKSALAQYAQHEFDRILSDLRMWIAKANYVDIYQGKNQDTRFAVGSSGGGSGGSGGSGGTSFAQSGLITFSRNPLAPFAVTAGSAVVTNLDADKLDGQHGAFYQTATNLNAGTVPDARFPATLPAISGVNLTVLPNNASLTGVPTAATAAPGTSTTQLATTAFVSNVFQTITLTGTQNDVALTAGCSVLRCNNATALTITGFSAGYDGQHLLVESIGTGQVNLAPQAGGSAAANRLMNIAASGNTSLVAAVGMAEYIYDALYARWRLIQHEQGGWITAPYVVGDFTGNGTGTTADWSLAFNLNACDYMLRGKSLTFSFDGGGAAIANNPTALRIGKNAYGGYTLASRATSWCQISCNSVVETGSHFRAWPSTSTQFIEIYRALGGAMASGGGPVDFERGEITFQVT